MKDSTIKKNQTVIIKGNKISSIGNLSNVPKQATVIDGKDKYLIPGLWDMHVHMWHERWEKSTSTIEGREVFLGMFIPNGITGVRDMGGDQKQIKIWKKEIGQGKLIGPRIVAGPIVDGPAKLQEDYIVVGTPKQAIRTVDSLVEQKVDFVKVYTTLPREAYFALANECNARHIPFEGHLPDAITAAEAAEAGQKTIEHLAWIPLSCSSKEDSLRKEVAAERASATKQPSQGTAVTNPLLERFKILMSTYDTKKAQALYAVLKKYHTWICPTLNVSQPFLWKNNQPFFQDDRIKYMPGWMRDRLNVGDLKNGIADDDMQVRKEWYKYLQKMVGDMHKANIPMLAGTDFPFFCFAGYSLHEELERLVQAGLSPYEALKTATSNPAKFLRKENELGTIEKGKLADLVLLNANPLENISNTKKIEAVVVNGKLLQRKDLDAMLRKVEESAKNQ